MTLQNDNLSQDTSQSIDQMFSSKTMDLMNLALTILINTDSLSRDEKIQITRKHFLMPFITNDTPFSKWPVPDKERYINTWLEFCSNKLILTDKYELRQIIAKDNI